MSCETFGSVPIFYRPVATNFPAANPVNCHCKLALPPAPCSIVVRDPRIRQLDAVFVCRASRGREIINKLEFPANSETNFSHFFGFSSHPYCALHDFSAPLSHLIGL